MLGSGATSRDSVRVLNPRRCLDKLRDNKRQRVTDPVRLSLRVHGGRLCNRACDRNNRGLFLAGRLPPAWRSLRDNLRVRERGVLDRSDMCPDDDGRCA